MSFTNGTAAVIVSDGDDAIPYSDPIAMDLYGGADGRAVLSGLGLFPDRGTQLGIFGIDDVVIAAAIPAITNLIRGASSRPGLQDPVAAVWQGLGAEQINAYVGPDGWWYDNDDQHRLSHEEAAQRQQAIVAASIGARVDPSSGWWMDDQDGHQLSHAEAWSRYQELEAGQPISRTPVPEYRPGAPSFPTTPIGKPRVQQGGMLAGLGTVSTPTLLLIGGAVVVAALLLGGRKAAR
jgi:hypothetical protein